VSNVTWHLLVYKPPVSSLEQYLFLCDIWGSHGGEDVDVGLLGCNAVWTGSIFVAGDGDDVDMYLQAYMALQPRRPTTSNLFLILLDFVRGSTDIFFC
jgi:hypothetical protein